MARGLAVAVLCLAAIIGGFWWYNRADEVRRQEEVIKNPPRKVSKEQEEALYKSIRIGAPEIAKEGPYPKAVPDRTYLNFGQITVSEIQEYTFHIKNEGEAPLKLVAGRKTCDCIRGEVKKTELAPGESTDVIVGWKGERYGSEYTQSYHVYTNDPKLPDITFKVAGSIAARILLMPAMPWRLGELETDQPVPVEGFIGTPFADKFEIFGIESGSPFVTAKAEPASKEKLAEHKCKSGYVLKAEVSPKFPVGKFEGEFRVKTNLEKTVDSPGATMVVTVTAFRSGPMRFMTATNGGRWYPESRSLFLGTFPSSEGKLSVLPVFIKPPEGGKQFEVTEIQSSEPDLRVELKPDEDQSSLLQGRKAYHLNFTVAPGLPPSSHTDMSPITIKMKTNHPDMPELEIKVIYISL